MRRLVILRSMRALRQSRDPEEKRWNLQAWARAAGHERSTAARLSLTRVQFVDGALQLFKLLTSLAELAFRCQALVVGEVFGGFRDEGVEVGCEPGRFGGCRYVSRRLRGDCLGAHR